MVNRLLEDRKLDFQPSFLFPVASSLGFFNQDMHELTKVLTKTFKKTHKAEGPRFGGLKVSELGGRFKVQMRNSLCFALLKGNALATYNQGTGCVVKPP